MLIKLRPFPLFIGRGHQRMSLLFQPLPDPKLILRGAQQARYISRMGASLPGTIKISITNPASTPTFPMGKRSSPKGGVGETHIVEHKQDFRLYSRLSVSSQFASEIKTQRGIQIAQPVNRQKQQVISLRPPDEQQQQL